jgi:hypothetical protein
MFFHLQYIHLFRPFLKYHPSSSPLPSHVSPRRICTANAGAISKLARLYKKSWDLRQICNIAVYMLHSACTIHLLNLNMEKTARRDITHGVRHLEEIAEDWPCARRTLAILSVLARKWRCELPAEAAVVLQRADEKFGEYNLSEVPSPHSQSVPSPESTERNGSGATMIPRENSPLMQYAQSQLNQAAAPSSIGDRLSMAGSMTNMGNMPVSRPGVLDTTSPTTALDSFAPDWRSQPPAPPSQMQDFPVGYVPGQPQQRQQRPQQQQIPPPAPVPLALNMDSQDWFLNDSARWQQSFETWNAGPGANSPVFVFNDRVASASPASSGSHAGGGANGGHATAGAGVVSGEANMGAYGFEGLGMSLQDGGWLPELD